MGALEGEVVGKGVVFPGKYVGSKEGINVGTSVGVTEGFGVGLNTA